MHAGPTLNEDLRPDESLALRFASDMESLVAARDRVRSHLEERGVDEGAIYAADLALEELAGNTLRYGYDEVGAGSLRIGVGIDRTSVHVSISDDARPFDPTRYPEPDPPRSLASTPIGGRGISMVRRSVRAMRYRREGRGNRIDVEIPRTEAGI